MRVELCSYWLKRVKTYDNQLSQSNRVQTTKINCDKK